LVKNVLLNLRRSPHASGFSFFNGENIGMKIAANDNVKPTKLISFAELTTTRGITFSRRHLKRLEDERKFPRRVVLGENKIGWVATEVDEWLAARLAVREAA
jgi:prophage regulatory protein